MYPFVPDTNLLHAPNVSGSSGLTSYSYARGQRYIEEGVSVARHAHVGEDVCAGAGTSIGEWTCPSMTKVHELSFEHTIAYVLQKHLYQSI